MRVGYLRLLEIPWFPCKSTKKLSKDESKALDEIPQPNFCVAVAEMVEVKEEELEEDEEESKLERLKRKAEDLRGRLKKVRRTGFGWTCFSLGSCFET